mgnify:CR=1 FL=1
MVFLGRALCVCVLVTVLGTLSAGPVRADEETYFYKGRQVRVLIGFGPGGGYDLIARLVARRFGEHLPGGASVVPQNIPGAGSLTAANNIANLAPRDGSVFGSVSSGMPAAPLLNPDQARFDSRHLSWLGSTTNEVQIDIVWHTSPVKTIEQLKTEELIIGGTGAGAATDDFPAVLREVLGLRFKIIPGYKGTHEVELAMERGEVQGLAGGTWNSTKARLQNWLQTKQIVVMAQYGRVKHPDLPDVPLIWDYAGNDTDRKALNLVFSRQEMGRPYVAPPELPAARLATLRAAFDATMSDPAFLADAAKADVEISPIDGPAVAKLVADLYTTPSEVVKRVAKALSPDAR